MDPVRALKKRKQKQNILLLSLLLAVIAAAAVCLFGGSLLGSLKGITEIIGLFALAFAVLVASRYLLKDYVYRLEEAENGDVDLTVTELQGKRRVTVCRIGLSAVEEILTETPETRKAMKERLKGMKRYDYCIDLVPSRSLYLLFRDRDETVSVRLIPDERMERILLERSGHTLVKAEGSEIK